MTTGWTVCLPDDLSPACHAMAAGLKVTPEVFIEQVLRTRVRDWTGAWREPVVVAPVPPPTLSVTEQVLAVVNGAEGVVTNAMVQAALPDVDDPWLVVLTLVKLAKRHKITRVAYGQYLRVS